MTSLVDSGDIIGHILSRTRKFSIFATPILSSLMDQLKLLVIFASINLHDVQKWKIKHDIEAKMTLLQKDQVQTYGDFKWRTNEAHDVETDAKPSF